MSAEDRRTAVEAVAAAHGLAAATLAEVLDLLEAVLDPRFHTAMPAARAGWVPPEPRHVVDGDHVWDAALRRPLVAEPVAPGGVLWALSALDHPGVAPVHDVIDLGTGLVSLRPVLDVTPLRDVGGPPAHRVSLLRHAAATVAAAHDVGLAHGGLTDTAIVVGPAGEVLVTGWTEGGTRHADVAALGRLVSAVAPDRELAQIGRRCARGGSASGLAADLRAWLQGTTRRFAAGAAVARGEALGDTVAELRERARSLRVEAAGRLAALRPDASEGLKAEGWALEDAADDLDRRARELDAEREQALRDAVYEDPTHVPARWGLLQLARAALDRAEASDDPVGALRAQAMMRAHLDAIPVDHPGRDEHAAWLAGDGRLTLVTDPPGVGAELFRLVPRGGRIEPVPARNLGTTPLIAVQLPMGTYLVVLELPTGRTVRYPVRLRRGQHWDGVPPGEAVPLPVPLPDDLGPDDVYVPAGWFDSGGDAGAYTALPAATVWVDGFVIGRFHVTVGEYLAFVEDAIRAGSGDLDTLVPRVPGVASRGAPAFVLEGDGLVLASGVAPGPWRADCPAVGVDHAAARAFCAWHAARTGLPWRLPGELELEKAARGVDARPYPWGSGFDPSWARVNVSTPGDVSAVPISAYPLDVSPYGVRHLAGNVADLALDPYWPDRPPNAVARAARPETVDPTGVLRWVTRGGDHRRDATVARACSRAAVPAESCSIGHGFRLARSIPGAATADLGGPSAHLEPPARG